MLKQYAGDRVLPCRFLQPDQPLFRGTFIAAARGIAAGIRQVETKALLLRGVIDGQRKRAGRIKIVIRIWYKDTREPLIDTHLRLVGQTTLPVVIAERHRYGNLSTENGGKQFSKIFLQSRLRNSSKTGAISGKLVTGENNQIRCAGIQGSLHQPVRILMDMDGFLYIRHMQDAKASILMKI